MKKVLNTLFIIASLGLIAAGAIFLCVSIFDHIDVERVTRGEGETGNGGEDEVEASYPGADAVEFLNHRGDTTTVYKSAGGTNIPFYL